MPHRLDEPEVYNLPEAPPQPRTPRGLFTGMVTMALLGVAASATSYRQRASIRKRFGGLFSVRNLGIFLPDLT